MILLFMGTAILFYLVLRY